MWLDDLLTVLLTVLFAIPSIVAYVVLAALKLLVEHAWEVALAVLLAACAWRVLAWEVS